MSLVAKMAMLQLTFTKITSRCQNSWRKAALQYTIAYGTFVKRKATTFQIVPQDQGILRKQNGSSALNGPRATVY
jgi:hypothetical protein